MKSLFLPFHFFGWASSKLHDRLTTVFAQNSSIAFQWPHHFFTTLTRQMKLLTQEHHLWDHLKWWGCVLNCFMLSSTLFPFFGHSIIPTSCYILRFYYPCIYVYYTTTSCDQHSFVAWVRVWVQAGSTPWQWHSLREYWDASTSWEKGNVAGKGV